jgi:hydrogenase-4 component B
VIAAGLALAALAVVAGWPAGERRGLQLTASAAVIASAAAFVVAGARGLAGHAERLSLGGLGGLGPAALHVDPLSGLFLIIAGGVAVPALCAAAAFAGARHGRLIAALALTIAAVAVIVTADNLFVLLFGWEALTLAFYLLTGFHRDRPGRARASLVTVVFGKASGAALLLGGLLLAAHTHTFALNAAGVDAHGALGQAAYALLLAGFAIKVGMLPGHVWLPRGYAAAPGPARAVMAGAAVNVGFYGMWRTLQLLGAPPLWLVCVVLVLAGMSAIFGIAQAAVHPDLAVLIGWSSVENAGLILAGFGGALVGAAADQPLLTAAGLVAATAQVVTHAMGKSLLFTAASVIERATGTTNLDRLGGIVRRLPWAGTGLVIGSLTLAGLPLTAGFASEWFILESLMQQFRVSSLAMQLCTAVAGVLVALTVGVAGVTFVRVVALTAFGPPRIDEPAFDPAGTRVDRNAWLRIGIALLITGCLGVAALAPLQIRVIARGLAPIVGDEARGANAKPWVLQPVFSDFSALSPSWLWIVLPAMAVLIAVVASGLAGRRLDRVRWVAPWSSASPGVHRGVGYTSFAYANPMRSVLGNVLLTRTELRGAPVEPSTQTIGQPVLTYRVEVVEVVDRYLYRPAIAALLAVARAAKRLQSGRLDAYMAYMLLAVLAVLAVIIAVSRS